MRQEDIKQLEGHPSFIVFLWDSQSEPLFVPFNEYEEIFRSIEPSPDGQFKAHVFFDTESVELRIPRAGRFNLEGLFGWSQLMRQLQNENAPLIPDLSHSQVQSILAAIGSAKGHDIWVPQNNRGQLQLDLTGDLNFRDELPTSLNAIKDILQEIDVLWLKRGSNDLCGLFEVEHSTPIYSALLRFNDVHLFGSGESMPFRIIAEESRKALFCRQLNRPTFKASGLHQLCSFLEYRNVYGWYTRLCRTSIPKIH